MTVKDLIISYANEELGIKICDSDTEKYLIPHIWRTDYLQITPVTKEYINKSFHLYDDKEVYSWEIIKDELFIYI